MFRKPFFLFSLLVIFSFFSILTSGCLGQESVAKVLSESPASIEHFVEEISGYNTVNVPDESSEYNRESIAEEQSKVYDACLIKLGSSGEVLFEKKYFSEHMSECTCVIQTSDGGYMMGGWGGTYNRPDMRYSFLKTDADGNREWMRMSPLYEDGIYSIVEIPGTGYSFAGYTRSMGNGSRDTLLFTTDFEGYVNPGNPGIFKKVFGEWGAESAFSHVMTTDGGYLLAGSTNSHGEGGSDGYLIKTDSSGNKEWEKTYGRRSTDRFTKIAEAADSGFVLSGYTDTEEAGGYDALDAWIVKVDSKGEMEWENIFGFGKQDVARGIVPTPDGGCAATGPSFSEEADEAHPFLLIINDAGETEFSLVIPAVDREIGNREIGNSLVRTSDGGYAITGFTMQDNDVSTGHGWVIKVSSEGQVEWKKVFDNRTAVLLWSIIETNNGELVAAGYGYRY